jgi:hypothetical protein
MASILPPSRARRSPAFGDLRLSPDEAGDNINICSREQPDEEGQLRLRDNEIDLVARHVVARLKASGSIVLDVDEPELLARIRDSLTADLKVEEDLNREVEKILTGHLKEIQEGSIDYRRMFAMIKSKLAKDRNIIIS